MQASLRWSVLPTAIAAVVAMSSMALSQVVSIAPNSQSVTLSGTSGGDKKDTSCAGFIADRPNHTVQVTADSNLKFTLQGSGQPTLLITGQGQTFCVQADRLSNGKVEIPGRWTRGNYSVFVGDQGKARAPYTLSIAPQ
ncbi:hypothetical protein IQ250_26615 [Pseudanabaenaceae cyanobacterium LEGE 13415]|nr:hypothetical protein [Pseudanabaenaceae cyanobacterium LEGE 13415]